MMTLPSRLWKSLAAGALAWFLIFAWNASQVSNPETPFLPKADLTPGRVVPATRIYICTHEISDDSFVAPITAEQLLNEYHINRKIEGFYEIKHLIPRSLGGSDDIQNLWPQQILAIYGVEKKNRLDTRLHELVCDGTLTLEQAQEAEKANWIEAYKRYVH